MLSLYDMFGHCLGHSRKETGLIDMAHLLSRNTSVSLSDKEADSDAWIQSFSGRLCDPPDMYTHWWKGPLRKKICTMVEPYYAVADELPMKKMYNHKYLPDIDGNSFSGRYRAFLLSSSMPLKSTIYAEWHDDRLVPWVHFVPFDNTYVDLYGIMDYFLRGRDAAAEGIAADGKRWAETVLRREDMRLYVWRLLLEYARVMDDNRDRLAFVQDWID
ncbi:hypothetical protein BN1723_001522 [Verticillium longisporum]|uniref:Glycosyl transferase CAP10 domain-containing protein n=1 Tax=Verticillium longisporum TaxID=100787 RepID=A0A0G4KGD5_VERLO|nr:hypothetical protein BN1723_001522 [Verticillium longisporum]